MYVRSISMSWSKTICRFTCRKLSFIQLIYSWMAVELMLKLEHDTYNKFIISVCWKWNIHCTGYMHCRKRIKICSLFKGKSTYSRITNMQLILKRNSSRIEVKKSLLMTTFCVLELRMSFIETGFLCIQQSSFGRSIPPHEEIWT